MSSTPEQDLADTVAAIVDERGSTDRTDTDLLDRIVRALDTYRLATQRPETARRQHCDECGSKVRTDWQPE